MTDASHFPVRSEIREGEQPSLKGTEPGTPILRDEIAESESDPGTSIGFVHIVLTRSRAKSADVVLHVVFNFDSGEVLTATGALPFHEEEDFDGGTLAITGGTGRYQRWGGVVTVERLGPHRWSVDGGA